VSVRVSVCEECECVCGGVVVEVQNRRLPTPVSRETYAS
jgi:hypothetical protein